MSRINTIYTSLFVGLTGIFLVSPAAAGPTVRLVEDWGQVSAEAWFDPADSADHQWYGQQGPARGGLDAQAAARFVSEWGLVGEVAASGRITPLDGQADLGLYALVEPAGSGEQARGAARTEFAWRLAVGQEAVNYHVDLWASGGASGLHVYDETAGATLADTGLYEGFGTSLGGHLLAGHTYQLSGFALADATRGGDPSAGLEFRSDATMLAIVPVPEPATALVLAVGLMAGRLAGRRRGTADDRTI